jgi:hypothetical protein
VKILSQKVSILSVKNIELSRIVKMNKITNLNTLDGKENKIPYSEQSSFENVDSKMVNKKLKINLPTNIKIQNDSKINMSREETLNHEDRNTESNLSTINQNPILKIRPRKRVNSYFTEIFNKDIKSNIEVPNIQGQLKKIKSRTKTLLDGYTQFMIDYINNFNV